MPARIPDDQRSAILDAIRSGYGERSAGSIARDHGVSDRLVRKVAAENGLSDTWSRDQTKRATAAAEVDHRARLVALAGRSAGLAERVLASFEAMDTDDWRDVSPHTRGIVLGIALDKAQALAPEDDDGAAEFGSMLGAMVAQYAADAGPYPGPGGT